MTLLISLVVVEVSRRLQIWPTHEVWRGAPMPCSFCHGALHVTVFVLLLKQTICRHAELCK